MTKLLDQALEVARGLPAEMQDDIARVMLRLAGDNNAIVVLTDDERSALAISQAQATRAEFATDEQVQAVWAKHGL